MEILLSRDINNIENKNMNELQLLYIDFYNATNCDSDKEKIEKEIDYIRENREVIELMLKTSKIDSVHEYRMLTDADYLVAHLKIDVNICPDCDSSNVLSYNCRLICKKCGVVIDSGCKPNYEKYNCYKRKTYVNQLIKKNLPDLLYDTKQRVISEACNILYQFDRDMNNRKFSYPDMFRRILKKLKLYEYADRFKPLKTPHVLKACDEFYFSIQY